MLVATSLKKLSFSEAMTTVYAGGAFVDVRPTQDYLDVHIPGSLGLLYESGPGFAQRARDCIPLDVPLVLLDLGAGDPVQACAALRGKGFSVSGRVEDGINEWAKWHGTPASTEIYRGPQPAQGFVLDVGDPGAGSIEAAARIPIDRLWTHADELTSEDQLVIAAGYGVRAALAVGMLERAGARSLVFWMTRGEIPR